MERVAEVEAVKDHDNQGVEKVVEAVAGCHYWVSGVDAVEAG